MKFSLIIPTKDRQQIINKTLLRLHNITRLDELEIIIINDSQEPVQIELEELLGYCKVVRNQGSGVASGRNYGASLAANEWLVFMDDDMWVQPDTFDRLRPLIEGKEDTCFNINWVYPYELNVQRKDKPFLRYLEKYGFDSLEGWSNDPNWQDKQPFLVEGVTSQFFIIHRTLFEKIGGYNASFPFAGFEDHDLSKRLKKSGVPVMLDPTNLIYHNEEDRMQVESWLERKKRGAVTRKVAVEMGYSNLALTYSGAKTVIYNAIWQQKRTILRLLEHWPNNKAFDPAYFFIVNRLFGTYVYIGYHTNSTDFEPKLP